MFKLTIILNYAELLIINADDTYSNNWALKG